MRKLPDRVWRLPRHEDDEAAEEGIGRILALSDGVFAIAITLLVLEIAVPATTSDAGLSKALLGLWPRYLAYILSRAMRARGLAGPVVFALTVPIAVFAPYAAEAVWILIFPLTRIVFVWFLAEEHEQPD